MNANDMTFGVEIECFLPVEIMREQGIQVGGYHRGAQIPGLPAGWLAQSDCSLHSNMAGYAPIEITSPVLSGRAGLEQVVAVVEQLKAWRFRTNQTCGLHVHIGAALRNNVRVVRNLINLAAKFERGLFAVTGTKRREHGNYASPISEAYLRIENASTWAEIMSVASKYRSLNLAHLGASGHGTIEFRVFQGTTNVTKLIGYIQLCLGLVERAYAITRKPSYRTMNKRYVTGSAVVYTMLRNIGWNSEKRFGEKKYGVLIPETLEAIKSEFRRLARKYDRDGQTIPTHSALRCPVARAR